MTFREPDFNQGFKEAGGGVLPAGEYKFCITEAASEVSDFDGEPFVNIELTVLEGDLKGRKMWKKFRFANPDTKIAGKAYDHWINLCACLGENVSPNEPFKLKQRVLTLETDVFKTDNGKEYPYISKWSEYGLRQNRAVQGAQSAAPADGPIPEDQVPF